MELDYPVKPDNDKTHVFGRSRLCHKQNDYQSPYRKQCIADRVGDGVAKGRHFAFCYVLNHA